MNKPIKVCKNWELHFIFHYFILGDTASREPDRESASNTGVAGASITGSVASSSYVAMKAIGGRHNRLEVSTNWKDFFLIYLFFNPFYPTDAMLEKFVLGSSTIF